MKHSQVDKRNESSIGGATQLLLHICKVKGKYKFYLWTGLDGLEGEHMYNCTVSLNLALEAGGCSTLTSRPIYPRERDQVPILQEAGWAAGQFLTGSKISPLPAFDLRTVQSVWNLYTNFAVTVSYLSSKRRRQYSVCSFNILSLNLLATDFFFKF